MASVNSIYIDRSRQDLIDLIQHLFAHSKVVIVVEGPAGSGRSCLLQHIDWLVSQSHSPYLNKSINIVDDVDLLPEHDLIQLIESNDSSNLLLSGRPGTFEQLKQGGYFNHYPIERLTIRPFTRNDAEQFLGEHCPQVPALIRPILLDQCPLYPGDLLQATYDVELVQSKPRSNRILLWVGALTVAMVITLSLLSASFYLVPEIQPAPATSSPDTSSESIIRVVPSKATQQTRTPLPNPTTNPTQHPTPPTAEKLRSARKTAQNSTSPAQPVAQPSVKLTTVLIAPTASQQLPNLDQQRLLNANPQHFTLQLMLASEVQNIDKLIKRFGLAEQSYRYAKLVDGQRRYCLLYGNFNTYEQASAAIRKLPDGLKKLGPWRRRFSAVQTELSTKPSQ